MEYLENLSEFYNCSYRKLVMYFYEHGIEGIENYAISISEEKTGYYLDVTGGF